MADPGATAVTTPPAEIVAIAVLPDDHTPPASLNVEVKPWQIAALPVIAAGNGLTVTANGMIQPLGCVYEIVKPPVEIPRTFPDASTVPKAVLLLDHVPPAVKLPRDVVKPRQTLGVPVIGLVPKTVKG